MEFFTSCVEKYGTIAQSWIMYVDYIHDFHNLECAIRTNDIDLFLHALTVLQPTTSTIQDGCHNSNLICPTLIVLTLACMTSMSVGQASHLIEVMWILHLSRL